MRRMRTNTPLQALVTLNDPVFVEYAQGLARRVIAEGGNTPDGHADGPWRWQSAGRRHLRRRLG